MKILVSAMLFMCAFSFAQISTATKLGGENSQWTFGGSAGLGGSFGNGGGTTVYLTPRVGYLISENFEVGASGNISWNNSQFVSSTILGVGPFANYYFARTAYISTQFQQYFINSKDKLNNNKFSTNESALYLGGGYMQNVGNGIYIQIGAMYNVLYDAQTSIFSGGFVPNVGVVVGL